MMPSTLSFFREFGYMLIDDFGLHNVTWLEQKVDSILRQNSSISSQMELSVTSYGESWIFSENILRYDQSLASFFLNGPLTNIAATLLGSSSVHFLRDQTYYKLTNAEETPWHQDSLFIPSDELDTLTFWIPFHSITPHHSPMSYIRHPCRQCYLGNSFDRFHTYESFGILSQYQGFKLDVFDDMEAGQILAHEGWAMHGSPSMTEGKTRKAMVVVYAKQPINLNSSASLSSCHPDLRSQALQIRDGNVKSYQSLLESNIIPNGN
jgi:hypothetical protein